MPENKSEFKYRLKEKMGEFGFTRASLAKRLEVKPEAVGHWLNGRNFPRAETLKKLSEVLGVTVSWLKYGKDENAILAGSKNADAATKSAPGSTIGYDRKQNHGLYRERRSPWHSDPRKNELLRMTAFILESDDPDITPAFESRIVEAHAALVTGKAKDPEPERKKKANHI